MKSQVDSIWKLTVILCFYMWRLQEVKRCILLSQSSIATAVLVFLVGTGTVIITIDLDCFVYVIVPGLAGFTAASVRAYSQRDA